jgi:tight adherence protein C
MPLLSAIVGSLSVFLFAMWYLRAKNQQEVRVRSLGDQQRMVVEQNDAFNQRIAFPFVQRLVESFMAVMPTSLVGRSRRWLITAGDRYNVSQFFTVVLLASTLVPALYFLLIWSSTGGSPSVLALLPVAALALFGVLVPMMTLRRMAKARQKAIWRSMPNALDLMTTCVEAGLSLDFAIQRVAERYQGGLSDEFHRMLREVGLGKTRREALTDLAERIDIPDVTTFVNSLIQAEALGTSVGQVLRVQSKQMRMRRRQRAEQIARRAPVKMVFPLVFFLMPSLFIVTIGPVILNVIQAFSEN